LPLKNRHDKKEQLPIFALVFFQAWWLSDPPEPSMPSGGYPNATPQRSRNAWQLQQMKGRSESDPWSAKNCWEEILRPSWGGSYLLEGENHPSQQPFLKEY